MKIDDLMEIAIKAYPESRLAGAAWERVRAGRKVNVGDTLAAFIVTELQSSYSKKAKTKDQLADAIRVMERAQGELEKVTEALREAQTTA